MTVDPARAASFGADADQYDRARPQYAPELVDRLLRDLPKRALDVGCGTGIASRPLLQAGCEVIGVEHDPRMAAVARRNGLHVDVARFEDWNPDEESSFDLVISGQAWHWIDPVLGPAKASHLLRADGRLAIFWVSYAHDPAVEAAFERAYTDRAPHLLSESFPLGGDRDRTSSLAAGYADALIVDGSFSPPEAVSYPGQRTYTVDAWIDELPTHSDHRLLPPALLGDLVEAVRTELGELGSTMTVDLATHLVTARRNRGSDPTEGSHGRR